MWLRIRSALAVNQAAILADASVVVVLLTAISHQNMWSVVLVALIVILLGPFCVKRRLQRILWRVLIACFTIMIVYQYTAALYWPPYSAFYNAVWPYTTSPTSQYFYLAFGPLAAPHRITPDFLCLMLLAVTWRRWARGDRPRPVSRYFASQVQFSILHSNCVCTGRFLVSIPPNTLAS